MRPRLLRVLLTLTALVVVWLVASPALAANASISERFSASIPVPAAPSPAAALPMNMKAPLCDPRGAITFAPPPQMQELEVTLDTGLTADDCFGSSPGDARRVAPGRAPIPIDASSASSDAAVTTTAVALAASARELLPAPAASTECSRPGFRSTVDRPPRA